MSTEEAAALEQVEQETRALLNVPYMPAPQQMQLFEDLCEVVPKKKKKTPSGLTWQQELFAQFLARGYTNTQAYRLSHPNCKTENMNTLYPKASRAAQEDKVKARVDEIRNTLKERALMSTTEFYARVSQLARGGGKDALKALELVGKIRGEFQAEKGLPGSDTQPLVVRWAEDPPSKQGDE